MTALLYLPQQPPQAIPAEVLRLPDSILEQVSLLFGCVPSMVDVLASGPDYTVYSVFDYEGGGVNLEAMRAVSKVTGTFFDEKNEDYILRGPILLIQMN